MMKSGQLVAQRVKQFEAVSAHGPAPATPTRKTSAKASTQVHATPDTRMTDLRDRKAALPTEEIVASDFLTREARPRRTSLALTPAALAPMVRNYVEIVDKGVPSTQGKNRTIRQLIDDLREQASPEQIAAAFKGVAQAQAGWLAQGGGVFEHLLPQMLEATPAPIKDYHLVAMACGLAWGLGQAGSARDTATLEDILPGVAEKATEPGGAGREDGGRSARGSDRHRGDPRA